MAGWPTQARFWLEWGSSRATHWQQKFTYDPFGNIKKDATVGTSFQPTYNQKKNWISALPGCTISYDANGNPLQDCARGMQDVYTWDAEGKPKTLDDVTVVLDALGRGVERRATVNPTFYGPIIYTPDGQKFASLVTYPGNPSYYVYRAFVPLPGGAKAVYGNYSYSLQFYRHPDWLGSGRLETAPDRTVYQSVGYGPCGEDYGKLGAQYDLSFTGQTQDEISATDDFLFRDYSAITGRSYEPDPAGLAAVDPANPQTWNRYAYVLNNPMSLIDPLGLCGMDAPPAEGALSVVAAPLCGVAGGGGSPRDEVPPDDGGGGGSQGQHGGGFANGETLGVPNWLPLHPPSILELLGLSDIQCDFGVCVPIGSGYLAGVSENGSPGSPFTIYVVVMASILNGGGTANNGTPQQPVKPFTLPLPNVPPGNACSKYSSSVLKAICNNAGNNPTSNCVRGYLLDSYDPKSGYSPGLIPAHCDAWSSCGTPTPLVWGACSLP